MLPESSSKFQQFSSGAFKLLSDMDREMPGKCSFDKWLFTERDQLCLLKDPHQKRVEVQTLLQVLQHQQDGRSRADEPHEGKNQRWRLNAAKELLKTRYNGRSVNVNCITLR